MIKLLEHGYNWAAHQGPEKPVRSPNPFVAIDDETLRDGLQGAQLDAHPSTGQKKIYLENVDKFVEHADIGFPGSESEHQKELEELIRFTQDRRMNMTLSVAGRGSAESDIKPIAELAHKTGYSLEADLFLDGSIYRSTLEKWDRQEKFKQLAGNIAFLKSQNLPVMFVPERATSTPPDELFEICKIAIESGADRIALADTVGIAAQHGIQNLLRWSFAELGAQYPDIKWDAHFHNDRGLATANCLVAAHEGIDRVHTTVFCLGERPGNADLGQVLLNFNLAGYRDTDLRELTPFMQLASDLLKFPIPVNAPVYGDSAHKTASGVHASALFKEQANEGQHTIYLAYPPESVGSKPGVEIGPFSGAANVRYKLRDLGLPATDEKIQEILTEAKHSRGILPDSTIFQIVKRNGHK
jgi:isopropylmalate/homocitrate/citramalate synthase